VPEETPKKFVRINDTIRATFLLSEISGSRSSASPLGLGSIKRSRI